MAFLPHGCAQLCAELRAAGVSGTMLPIIVMSGHSEKALVEQAKKLPNPAAQDPPANCDCVHFRSAESAFQSLSHALILV